MATGNGNGTTPTPTGIGSTRQRGAWYAVVAGVVLPRPHRSRAQALRAASKAASFMDGSML